MKYRLKEAPYNMIKNPNYDPDVGGDKQIKNFASGYNEGDTVYLVDTPGTRARIEAIAKEDDPKGRRVNVAITNDPIDGDYIVVDKAFLEELL